MAILMYSTFWPVVKQMIASAPICLTPTCGLCHKRRNQRATSRIEGQWPPDGYTEGSSRQQMLRQRPSSRLALQSSGLAPDNGLQDLCQSLVR